MLSELLGWLDFTKSVALTGLTLSLVSLLFSWSNRRMALKQEARKVPNLVPSLLHCYFQEGRGRTGRMYACQVEIANPSDNNNAVAFAELVISYRKADPVVFIMKLKQEETPAEFFKAVATGHLQLPLNMAAHSASTGWLFFHLPAPLTDGMVIDSLGLEFNDPHGQVFDIKPLLPREFLDETDR